MRIRESITELEVDLRAARIPWIGWLAWHHWLVVRNGAQLDRWEVWQRPAAGGQAWGYLHCNLLPAERGVGAGASWVICSWRGESARRLAARLAEAPRGYPFLEQYHYWPGPNSNTFVQWALEGMWELGPRAPGRRFGREQWRVKIAPPG